LGCAQIANRFALSSRKRCGARGFSKIGHPVAIIFTQRRRLLLDGALRRLAISSRDQSITPQQSIGQRPGAALIVKLARYAGWLRKPDADKTKYLSTREIRFRGNQEAYDAELGMAGQLTKILNNFLPRTDQS
jgi:hypothetical protein